jgi:RNA 2',3'-cyclic 3'-phosphodiesterase
VKLRLFVALDLPEPAREALAAFRAAAADPAIWRPLADDALHLTLAFLGHRPEADVSAIVDGLTSVPHAAPRLRLGAALGLPPRRPRVLTAEIEDLDGTLAALQAAVSEALAARGLYEPEARAYRPHATVARLRVGGDGLRARRGGLPAPAPLEFHGEALTLYRSHLRRAGAGYEPLARFPLAV